MAENANLIKEIKSIKARQIRELIPKECYVRSNKKTFFFYFLDLFVFSLGLFIVFMTDLSFLKLLGGVIAGLGTTMLFGWGHDAAHGALFKNSKVAELLGTIALLPSLNMYRMWSFGHNKVHHGFTSFTPIDWIWRPYTPSQYSDLSLFRKLIYKIERSLPACGLHYLIKVWWAKMVRYNPGKDQEQRRYYLVGKVFTLLYIVLMTICSYIYAGGLIGVIAALIIPFIVFTYHISFFVYLHHTHPEMPLFEEKSEWSHSVAALHCSSIVNFKLFTRIIYHNIMVHIPHHLDTRIPFYHLPKAYLALKKDHMDYIHEYDFNWIRISKIFKQCKLYDYNNKRWLTYKEASEIKC